MRRQLVGKHRRQRRAVINGRLTLLGVSGLFTLIVGLGATGILPTIDTSSAAGQSSAGFGVIAAQLETIVPVESDARPPTTLSPSTVSSAVLPENSGAGKRVVFSLSRQRVWLVDESGKVERTYEASGSIHDNLKTGAFEVQSRTRHATSYDYESTMDYFVQFTSGQNAPIGFHDIPVDASGDKIQTLAELGTPLSSGCIRQARPDAVALWEFATVGTPVRIVA